MWQFNVWRTIDLGTHKSLGALLKAGADAGNEIAENMSDPYTLSFNVAQTMTPLELFRATIEELGFPVDGATWQEIRVKLNELDFGKCPEEAAVQLWRQYDDQPDGDMVCVVTDPLIECEHFQKLAMLVISEAGKRILTGHPGDDCYKVPGHVKLVFCHKQPA